MNPNKSTEEMALIQDIDTPAIVVDLNIVKENINTYQKYCDDIGIKLRPHVKTHKIPALAKLQIRAGAVGVTAQKISEAEAIISEGGIDDVLITYNIIGEEKETKMTKSNYTWVIDPIDGTKSMIMGLPNWSNLISLYEKDKCLVSFANFPILKKYYLAYQKNCFVFEKGKLKKEP